MIRMKGKAKIDKILDYIFGSLFLVCLGIAIVSGIIDFFNSDLGNLFIALFLVFAFLVFPVLLYVFTQKGEAE